MRAVNSSESSVFDNSERSRARLILNVSQADEKTRDIIPKALQRICVSAEFARAGRAKELLCCIVRHALDKPGVALTEREIAAEVLKCGGDWDPKLDPTVRIMAGRLRTKLDRYYEIAGESDSVRIELPKGTYVPRFVLQEDTSQATVEAVLVPEPRALAQAPPEGEHSVRPNRAFRVAAYLATAALFMFLVWRFVLAYPHASPLEQRPYSTSPLTDAAGRESGPTVSPDGKDIAFAWDANGNNFDIYLIHTDGTGLRRLTDSQDPEFSPAWSPDGKQVAFIRVRDYQAYIVAKPIAGGSERVVKAFRAAAGSWSSSLDPVFDDIGPVWSPDRRHLLFSDLTDQHALVEVEIETGRTQRLTSPYDLTKDIRDFYPRYSADGRYVAYAHFSSHGSGDLYVLERASGKVERLTNDKCSIRGLTWTPDRRHLVFASDRDGSSRLWTVDISSPGSLQLLPSDSPHVLEPAAGPFNDWLVYVDSTESWALRRYEVAPSGLRNASWILPTNGRDQNPRYSPDGKHIAFVSDRSGRWDVWLANSDGAQPMKLTSFDGHYIGLGSWSPDGTSLAFDSRPNGNSNIFTVRIADGKLIHLIDSPYEDRVPIWSNDGRSIYFSSTRSGSLALYRLDLRTREISPFFPNIFAASESPDRKLVFGSDNVGNFNVFTPDWVPAPNLSQLIKPDPVLNWSASGSGLYFTARAKKESSLAIVRYAHGALDNLGSIDHAVVPGMNISASPDGRYIVVAEVVAMNSNLKIRRLVHSASEFSAVEAR